MTEIYPASTVAQIEIFGPVAVSLTFRTPDEAIALANNTRYGLAASIWSENINLALDVAAKVKAGVVWLNCTNLFDAGAGFGGYKESGFGREGGREGMAEYLIAAWSAAPAAPAAAAFALSAAPAAVDGGSLATRTPGIDRTAKLYVGGKQSRPDSGSSFTVFDRAGIPLGQAGLGNRKDIRNAVESAAKAGSRSSVTAHNRAQVLYYIAENLAAREVEFVARIAALTGATPEAALQEVTAAIARTFWYAAWADKYDGAVRIATKSRHYAGRARSPPGVMGIVCPDEAPLLAFISLVMPALAMGNRVVAVPSDAIRSQRPICTKCSTPATCRAASSAS